jgi:hypothetical protein
MQLIMYKKKYDESIYFLIITKIYNHAHNEKIQK